MDFNNQNKFGLYIFIINIILTLFLLTTNTTFIYYVITIISNIIAIVMNVSIIKTNDKNTTNVVSLIANIIVPNLLIIMLLVKYNII